MFPPASPPISPLAALPLRMAEFIPGPSTPAPPPPAGIIPWWGCMADPRRPPLGSAPLRTSVLETFGGAPRWSLMETRRSRSALDIGRGEAAETQTSME